MIQIKALKEMTYESVKNFGFNGFMTDYVYDIKAHTSNEAIGFTIEKVALQSTYVKEWQTSKESVADDNQRLKLGLSLGAYEGDQLVGFLIVSKVAWNNSLWIENIRVSDTHRGKGIAKALLKALKTLGHERDYRLIGLEVMATNYPAIELYKKNGYRIDGLDMSHYPTRPKGKKEIALFMKCYLGELI